MKKSIIVCCLILWSACAEKPLDVDKAKQVVEALIEKTDKKDWNGIEALYTAEFNASEPPEVKIQKLIRLRDTLGPVKSKTMVSSTQVAEFGIPQQVELIYRVVHNNATTIETFSVEEDEGGYKISGHSVETE